MFLNIVLLELSDNLCCFCVHLDLFLYVRLNFIVEPGQVIVVKVELERLSEKLLFFQNHHRIPVKILHILLGKNPTDQFLLGVCILLFDLFELQLSSFLFVTHPALIFLQFLSLCQSNITSSLVIDPFLLCLLELLFLKEFVAACVENLAQ